ncbi:DUF1672 family protein [Virgibacillus soli]|uniref:DUF1672 family protein n=1 Tax=Paracerasibacillus soli TaxID=480284 RepID=UPI0035EB69CA
MGKKPDTLNTDEEKVNEFKRNDYEKENYVRVQDYTGEGYTLRDSKEKNREIAIQHQDEVEKAVKEFFLTNYHLNVEVNNIVAAVDGVAVHVESIENPNIHTFAIVPVDIKSKIVHTNQTWSLEGEVEKAIKGSLYVKANEKEFANLNRYLNSIEQKYPVTTVRLESIKNTSIRGYNTQHYFIAPAGKTFNKLFIEYMNNPSLSPDSIVEFFKLNPLDPRYITISIEFFMENENEEPSIDILDEIIHDLENMSNIPKGAYSIYLHDNYIDKQKSIGYKSNTLERSHPNQLIKK